MLRIPMPSGWYIQPDDETAIESEYWLYDEQHTGIMIAAFDLDGAQQFAAAMNAPRPAEAALAEEVERMRSLLSAICDTTHQPNPHNRGPNGLNNIAPGKMLAFSAAVNKALAAVSQQKREG